MQGRPRDQTPVLGSLPTFSTGRPEPATAMLVQQTQRQLFEAARQEGMVPENSEPAMPTRATAPRVTPRPTPRPNLDSNVTYQAMLSRGVHADAAAGPIGNADLAIKMLRNPDLYREPGTPATRLLDRRAEIGSAVGGLM